jgi:hypothetical protein
MKPEDRIHKQATDMVDMALEWVKLSSFVKVSKEGREAFEIFNAMQIEVLKTYTNIEELSEKADKKD